MILYKKFTEHSSSNIKKEHNPFIGIAEPEQIELFSKDEAKELLGIPSEAMIMALVPMGYPSKGRWSQPRRNNVETVTFWDGWCNSQVR